MDARRERSFDGCPSREILRWMPVEREPSMIDVSRERSFDGCPSKESLRLMPIEREPSIDLLEIIVLEEDLYIPSIKDAMYNDLFSSMILLGVDVYTFSIKQNNESNPVKDAMH
jgi:hypothetical protein